MKKYKVMTAVFAVICVVLLGVLIYLVVPISTNNRLTYNESDDLEYIQTTGNSYAEISEESVNLGYFTSETFYRIENTVIVDDWENTRNFAQINFPDKVYKTVVDDENILFKYSNSFWGDSKYYAEKSFTFPQISAENISKVEIYRNSTVEPTREIAATLENREEISDFIENYDDYCEKYDSSQPCDFSVYYTGYSFYEDFSQSDLEYLLDGENVYANG